MRIFLNAIKELPHAEERPKAGLEARTVLLQRFFDPTSQFPDSLPSAGTTTLGALSH
jgi:hypothetical protein